MPEYLAPGVYVEEIDTGSKPIEGVSTSTAGLIGVTERGPINTPILITSYGEYTRWFGERLNIRDFDGHCYLPHAVEGFFVNGGKRIFVTRVLDTSQAAPATTFLFNRGVDPGANTALLRPAAPNTGTAANPPLLVVLPDSELDANDMIRIGDGSDAEYRQAAVDPVDDRVAVTLSLPLSRSHADPAGTIAIGEFTPGGPLRSFQLVAPAPATRIPRGEQIIEITGVQADLNALIAAATPPPLLQISEAGMGNISEYRFALQITRVSPTNARVALDSPLLLSYAQNASINHLELLASANTANLDPLARAGDSLLFVDDRSTNFDTRTNLVVINRTDNATREVRRIGELRRVTFTTPLTEDYPASTLVQGVSLSDDSHITINAASAGHGTAANPIVLTNSAHAAEISAGQTLILGTGGNRESAVVQSVTATGRVELRSPLAFAKSAGDPVIPVRSLTAAARSGAGFVALGSRQGLAVGDVLRIGAPPNESYVTITLIPNRAVAGSDPGNVIFAPPLPRDVPLVGTPVVRQNPVTVTNVQPSVLVLAAEQGTDTVLVSDGGGGAGTYAINSFVRLTRPNGEVFYHRVSAISANPLVPQMVTLTARLNGSHRAGAPVLERQPLLAVQALDPGAWGNRLRISVEDEPAGLLTRTTLAQFGPATSIRLASAAGVEAGTILEFLDANGNTMGPLQKVTAINRATGDITLAGTGLSAGQQVNGLGIRSREFSLTVRLLRQPDPAIPSRNETVIDLETFRYLSLDPRHSRYVHNVIGTTWTPGNPDDDDGRPLRRSDRRSEGESAYIRVRDVAWALAEPQRTATLQSVRLGPETLTDLLPTGQRRPARHRLDGGDDSIAMLNDNHYIGADSPDPEDRTGLQSLRNIEEISIVAAPGRTGALLQGALIAHCELMRYRFAVLDGPRPPADALADVQFQRQQFDTKYAALYHPWLLVPDPYPNNPAQVAEYPIPPSGHIVGIYARTDIERGVHKAPANEVVRGTLGLRRVLNKEQHDILNPYPVNINVIRDFRPNNRGIRVFGGRVITSDSDWKYVNVRRLLIFIEASIDRGLQWVVFEPNAEPLWARVRRTISSFLTVVWRNGALEGTKPEEAYFVKCDRTTMTQLDIDSGRLICVIGVAPVKPAEFVIIRIGLWTARAEE